MLELCNGPPCPKCGCQDVHIHQHPAAGSWFGSGRARCKHCSTMFSFKELPAEEEIQGPSLLPMNDEPADDPEKCPKCAGQFHAYSTKKKTQYRKCKDCGHKGKTVKKVEAMAG